MKKIRRVTGVVSFIISVVAGVFLFLYTFDSGVSLIVDTIKEVHVGTFTIFNGKFVTGLVITILSFVLIWMCIAIGYIINQDLKED